MDLEIIKQKVRQGIYDLSAHAHRERQEEQILVEEIEKAILQGDIIEEYSNDPRGASCLITALINGKALHVVCGFRGERLLIVTVYRPKLPTWRDYKTRVKELKNRV